MIQRVLDRSQWNIDLKPVEDMPGFYEVQAEHVERRWYFPPSRFVEYGIEDEDWAIPLSFGHWSHSVTTLHFPLARVISADSIQIGSLGVASSPQGFYIIDSYRAPATTNEQFAFN